MDMLEGKDNIEFKCIYKIKFNEKSGGKIQDNVCVDRILVAN